MLYDGWTKLMISCTCRPLRYGTFVPSRLLRLYGGHESGGHVRYGRAEPASLHGDDEKGCEAAQAIGTFVHPFAPSASEMGEMRLVWCQGAR